MLRVVPYFCLHLSLCRPLTLENIYSHCCCYFLSLSHSPFNNPTETYRYYSLPFCSAHATEEEEEEAAEGENVDLARMAVVRADKREGAVRHKQRLGESIVGDRRETSPYEITFMDICRVASLVQNHSRTGRSSKPSRKLFTTITSLKCLWKIFPCGDTLVMPPEKISSWERSREVKTYLFPHLHFHLGYNDRQDCFGQGDYGCKLYDAMDQVDVRCLVEYSLLCSCCVQMDRRVDITDTEDPKTVQFSYSVEWYRGADLLWKDRMSLYAESRFVAVLIRDSLALHHQLLCLGSSLDGLFDHYSIAGAQERLFSLHGVGR